MSLDMNLLWLIIGCALVTWLPRIIPFIFVRNVQLPELILRWLKYIPVCVLSAIIIGNLLQTSNNRVSVNWAILITLVPTIAVAIHTKSLSLTVIVGVACMALTRLFLS